MVLDHLVVQQMGKDNEEGEIDNMLLHGAAALYEANEDGIAASDIQYTSQNVDELIDKVEQDAEVEAEALVEKEEAAARGETVTEIVKAKETMSFGFAKIWEADQKRLKEVSEEEDRPEDTMNAWQLVVENAEKERRKRLDIDLKEGRSKRKAAAIKYRADGILSDETPGKKKSKKTTKGKKYVDSSDAEYAAVLGQSESETDSITSFPDGVENLMDEHGNPFVRCIAAGKKTLSRKERKKIEIARAMEKGKPVIVPVPNGHAAPNSVNGNPAPNAIAGPSTTNGSKSMIVPETYEQRAIRKATRTAEKKTAKDRFRQMQAGLEQQIDQRPNGASSSAPHDISSPRHAKGTLPTRVHGLMDAAKLQAGQAIFQFMYQILRECNMGHDIDKWALMALPEIPVGERKHIYLSLAQAVDDQLHTRRMDHYFTKPDVYNTATFLLDAGVPIIPDTIPDGRVPPLPVQATRWRDEAGSGPPPPQQHLSPQHYNPHPTPHESPQTIPEAIAAPAVQPDHLTAPDTSFKPMVPAPRSPRSPHTNGDLLDGLMDSADQQTCAFCQKGHSVQDCAQIPTVKDLEGFRDAILESDEPEEEKVS